MTGLRNILTLKPGKYNSGQSGPGKPEPGPVVGSEAAYTFRSWLWLFVGMVAAELGVLLPMLAPGRVLDLNHLSVVSLYAQWINILALASLMLLEPWLMRLPRIVMWLCAWILVIAVAAGVAALVSRIDQELLWGLTDPRWQDGHLVFRTVLLTALLAGLVLRYQVLHRRWQDGLKAQEQARFQALQARIHPHFLFNSLNTIAALTVEQPERAERAIENLSDLLRGTLRDPERPISLSAELDLCRSYLEIEALRLGPRLRQEWQLQDLPMALPVPPLLLQPLIENAIIHGVQRCPEGGVIYVRGWRMNDELVVEINNPLAPKNGDTEPVTGQTATGQAGIALDNLRGRLDLRYAGAARLETMVEGGRFIARVYLPADDSGV